MNQLSTRVLTLSIIIFVAISMSSCSLFRKKNKCDTCPSWKAEVEQTITKTEQV